MIGRSTKMTYLLSTEDRIGRLTPKDDLVAMSVLIMTKLMV